MYIHAYIYIYMYMYIYIYLSNDLNSKHMLLGGMWYVGTVRVVQGYGAGGTVGVGGAVARCRGSGGYDGGVEWVR